MRYRVEGGYALEGAVAAPGAKNAALPLLAASLLTDQPVALAHVPPFRDLTVLMSILEALGKAVTPLDAEEAARGVRVAERAPPHPDPPPDEIRALRASFLVLGPLLVRCGRARVPLPGGDDLGPRPVDLHLEGLRAMGARIVEHRDHVDAEADGLAPAEVPLRSPSVGATEHLMMTAAGLPGTSVIRNAAREPEVDDLGELLRAMGASVERAADHIRVEGTPELGGAQHRVMPDRIWAGTVAIAAALTGGSVRIDCRPWHVRPLADTLQTMNVDIGVRSDGLTVRGTTPRRYAPTAIRTEPYPGFPTDLHPPIVPLLTQVPGESRLTETIFADRFSYRKGLAALGADVRIEDRTVRIRGGPALKGASVTEHRDNRAAAALVLAGLAAEGTTIVHDVHDRLPRGYGDLATTLTQLGASVQIA